MTRDKLNLIKKNAFLEGYRSAYDKMTEVQKAQLRTAENGMIVTSQDAIDKMVADAMKDALYEEKQKRIKEHRQLGSAEELYQRIKGHAYGRSDQTSPYYFVDLEDVKKEIFGPCMRSFFSDRLLDEINKQSEGML